MYRGFGLVLDPLKAMVSSPAENIVSKAMAGAGDITPEAL
jgi:hypothetical protein